MSLSAILGPDEPIGSEDFNLIFTISLFGQTTRELGNPELFIQKKLGSQFES